MSRASLTAFLFVLVLSGRVVFAEDKPIRHECEISPSFLKSELLIFEGRFENFEESAPPHVLNQDRREMMQFRCEDIPVLFYISPDAVFIRTFSKGQKIKVYGYSIGRLEEGALMLAVQSVEEL